MSKNQNNFDSLISADLKDLIERASRLEKWPLAQLISLFETNTPQAKHDRHGVISWLSQNTSKPSNKGLILGVTGTPGAGKSSLIGELCIRMLADNPALSIAVLAIDPSSQRSGGSLLGDRTRTNFPVNDHRLFFRSQASGLDLGGVGKSTFQVTRLLRQLFDIVIIETVGIGQSEVEVGQLSDYSCLIMQPLAGDQVQFMKAGIMEIPDAFIINKCDENELAQTSYHLLKSSLKLVNVSLDCSDEDSKPVFLTSALKKTGIGDLSAFLLELESDLSLRKDPEQQELFYLEKWVLQEFGRFGLGLFDEIKRTEFKPQQSYEEKEHQVREFMRALIPSLD